MVIYFVLFTFFRNFAPDFEYFFKVIKILFHYGSRGKSKCFNQQIL